MKSLTIRAKSSLWSNLFSKSLEMQGRNKMASREAIILAGCKERTLLMVNLLDLTTIPLPSRISYAIPRRWRWEATNRAPWLISHTLLLLSLMIDNNKQQRPCRLWVNQAIGLANMLRLCHPLMETSISRWSQQRRARVSKWPPAKPCRGLNFWLRWRAERSTARRGRTSSESSDTGRGWSTAYGKLKSLWLSPAQVA